MRRPRKTANNKPLGYSLAKLRRERQLTQADVASRMSITKARVSHIECGYITHMDILKRYIEALGGTLIQTALFEDGVSVQLTPSKIEDPIM